MASNLPPIDENSPDIQDTNLCDLGCLDEIAEILAARNQLYTQGDEFDIFLANTSIIGNGENTYIVDSGETLNKSEASSNVASEHPALRDLYTLLMRYIGMDELRGAPPKVLFNTEYFRRLGIELYDFLDLLPWSDLDRFHKIALTKTSVDFLKELKDKPENIVFIDTSIATSQELIRAVLEKGQSIKIGGEVVNISHNILVIFDDEGKIEFHRKYFGKDRNLKSYVRLCLSTNVDTVTLLLEWSDYTKKQQNVTSVGGRSIQIQFGTSDFKLLNIEELRYSGIRNKASMTDGIYLEYNPNTLEYEITGVCKSEDLEKDDSDSEDDIGGETVNIDTK